MINPQKLIYNDEEINSYLNEFNVILDVSFDSDNGATSSFLNRSAVAAESHDGRYKNTHKYKYDELFSPQFTFVKQDFSDFSQSEVRKVLKYLTQTDKPALIEVSYDKDGDVTAEEDRDFCAVGGWTNIELYKIANSRTVGIIATFEAVTPYAMSTLHEIPITQSDSYKKTITVYTDDNSPIYPYIKITKGNAAGTVTITNQHSYLDEDSDPVTTEIKNNSRNEIIELDGANGIISSSSTKRIFGSDFNWVWLPLYDGDNDITVTGNCSVTLKFREIRKIGEW